RLFQNFSFWNSYLKKPQFCRLQAEKLQEPVTKQPVLEQAQFGIGDRTHYAHSNLLCFTARTSRETCRAD
ncbi:MAG: hypothetical protein LBC72_03525, partial [Spirochaetaceae bacterium]|nr:hypothetical protein [Spirochaetaceae bacterium]